MRLVIQGSRFYHRNVFFYIFLFLNLIGQWLSTRKLFTEAVEGVFICKYCFLSVESCVSALLDSHV